MDRLSNIVLILCFVLRAAHGQGETNILCLIVIFQSILSSVVTAGTLGFVLNGVSHRNGSTVLRTDIGEGAAALLSDVSVSITASGINAARQTYRLECSATLAESINDQPTFTWLDPMNNPIPCGMVTTTGSTSTLTFSPLAVSHAGRYTCRVTAGGVTETQITTVIVKLDNSGIHQPV